MRKGHGIHPYSRTYKPRSCEICGSEFTPNHPRTRRCESCSKVRCSLCGKDISSTVRLRRQNQNKTRFCSDCFLSGRVPQDASHRAALPDGTRRVRDTGYVEIKINGEWRLEHRVIAEQMIGRSLETGEIVHHRDENKTNNHPDNLEVIQGLRSHLEHRHASNLKNPPVHHNSRRPKGSPGYIPITAEAVGE